MPHFLSGARAVRGSVRGMPSRRSARRLAPERAGEATPRPAHGSSPAAVASGPRMGVGRGAGSAGGVGAWFGESRSETLVPVIVCGSRRRWWPGPRSTIAAPSALLGLERTSWAAICWARRSPARLGRALTRRTRGWPGVILHALSGVSSGAEHAHGAKIGWPEPATCPATARRPVRRDLLPRGWGRRSHPGQAEPAIRVPDPRETGTLAVACCLHADGALSAKTFPRERPLVLLVHCDSARPPQAGLSRLPHSDSDGARGPSHRELARADVVPMHRMKRT
jgi:hypothetical protein